MQNNFLGKKSFSLLTVISLFICFSLCFSLLVIKDFSHPIDGVEDLAIWEYMGFYFSKNLNLFPFPILSLNNNQVFYPYGTSSVFQGWGVEKDIFYAVLYLLFGIGPWLQFYYLFTVLITAIGTFGLLVRDYGIQKAAGVSFLVSFCNFYAIQKYPIHFDNAVIHWTTLNLIADFLIVKKIVLKEALPLQMILVKACLIVLCFGQGLGYVAGFGLMSFTICSIFIFTILIYRIANKRASLAQFKILLSNYHQDFLNHRRTCLLLITITIIIGYIYLPLALEIAQESKRFDFSKIPNGAWWTNPLRLLVALLPPELFSSYYASFLKVFGDSPAGSLPGSPGLFLVIIGALGLWQTRKKIYIFIPQIIMFILCLSYHPDKFPILRVFPWFAFNRLTERSTNIYPVILCIFALHVDSRYLQATWRKILSLLLVLLACTEFYTAYSVKLNYQPYSFDKNFYSYMDYVKKQPGEAVLDFPFCAVGGNGVGARELCPYYLKTAGLYGLRRFHHKKVMGQYFGRLHPSQIQPYLQAGWDKLFFPDSQDIFKAATQTRCFKPDEWSFFTDFYKLNDFAGINLYVDLLLEKCAQEFYEKFGYPVIETIVPGAGRVKFLPKSAEFRKQVNLALGASLKFEPLLDFSNSDLMKADSDQALLAISGLNSIEGETPNHWRWALGPETNLKFKLPQSQTITLSFFLESPIDGQSVIVEVNNKTVLTMNDIRGGDILAQSIQFQGLQGINHITFKYKLWNKNTVNFAPDDNRPVAVSFTKLSLQSEE